MVSFIMSFQSLNFSDFCLGPSGRLIKEEYNHDCIQMDVPPCLPPQQDHQGAMKLPPPDHYGQPLPPLQLPSEPTRAPPPVTLYSNMPLSPTGKHEHRMNCSALCIPAVYSTLWFLFSFKLYDGNAGRSWRRPFTDCISSRSGHDPHTSTLHPYTRTTTDPGPTSASTQPERL